MLKLDDIVAFVDRFAKEDHYDNDAHQNNLDELEKDFVANHTSPTNVFMMAKPECLYQSDPTISLWSDGKSEAASKTAATLNRRAVCIQSRATPLACFAGRQACSSPILQT